MDTAQVRQEVTDLRRRLEELESKVAQEKPKSASSNHCSSCERASDANLQLSHAGVSAPHHVLDYPMLALSAGALRVRATIDSTRNDNGFLGCVDARYRATNNTTVLSHGNTATAAANIRTGSEGISIIVGHGAPGIIVCGTGQIVDGTDKFIAASNEAVWRPLLSQGVVGSQLTLFGCQVAAGTAGADLLKRVANAVRKPVGAWTGDVWCNSSQVWGTGQFVVVQPGRRFSVMEAAELFERHVPLAALSLRSHNGGFEPVRIGQVRSVHFSAVGSIEQRSLKVEGSDAQHLLQAVDFERPFVTEDKPGSLILGLLTVTFEGEGVERVRAFRVLGASLLQDVLFPDTYYYTSSELTQQILK